MLPFFPRLIGSISENRQYFATFTLPALFSIIRGSLFLWKFFIKKKKKKKKGRRGSSYQLSEIELHMGEIFPEFFLSVKLKEDSVGLDKSNKLWYYSTISTRSLVPLEQFPYLRGVLREDQREEEGKSWRRIKPQIRAISYKRFPRISKCKIVVFLFLFFFLRVYIHLNLNSLKKKFNIDNIMITIIYIYMLEW